MNSVIREKIMAVIATIKKSLVQRDSEIDLIFAALLARHHALLVGPPGVAKSLLAESIKRVFKGAKVFSVQMVKGMPREALFGHLNVPGLVRGESYERVLDGSAADCHLLILEEVYNSDPGSLNNLLTLMNERVYMEGVVQKKTPLMTVIGTSNSFKPDDSPDAVNAFSDRFLFRKEVHPVLSRAGLRKLNRTPEESFTPTFSDAMTMTIDDLAQAQADVKAMPWTEEARDAFDEITFQLHDAGIQPTNRRLVHSRRAPQCAAYMAGNSRVEKADLGILCHTLWDQPEVQPKKAKEIIMNVAAPADYAVANAMQSAEENLANVDVTNVLQCREVVKKLEALHASISGLRGNKKADDAIRFIASNIKALKVTAVETSL